MSIEITYVERAIERIEQIKSHLHRRFANRNEKDVFRVFLNVLFTQAPRHLVLQEHIAPLQRRVSFIRRPDVERICNIFYKLRIHHYLSPHLSLSQQRQVVNIAFLFIRNSRSIVDNLKVIRAIEAISSIDLEFIASRALRFVQKDMGLQDKKDIIETITNIPRDQRSSVCLHAESFAFGNFSSDEIIRTIREIAQMPFLERADNVMLTLPLCESSQSPFYHYGIIRSFLQNTTFDERKELALLLRPFFVKIDQAILDHGLKVKMKKELINLLMNMLPTQRKPFCERAYRLISELAPHDSQNRLILIFMKTLASKPFDEQHVLCEYSFSLASSVAKSKKHFQIPLLERASFFLNIFSGLTLFDRSHIHRLVCDFVYFLEASSLEDEVICELISEMSKLPIDEREKVLYLAHQISPRSSSPEDKMHVIKSLCSTSKDLREVACFFATKYGRAFQQHMEILSVLRFVPKESYDRLFLSAFRLAGGDILNDHGVCFLKLLSYFPLQELPKISQELTFLLQNRDFLNAENPSIEWLYYVLEKKPDLLPLLHVELAALQQKMFRSPQESAFAHFILQHIKILRISDDHLVDLDLLRPIILSPQFFFKEVYCICESSQLLKLYVFQCLAQRFSKDHRTDTDWFTARDLLLSKNIDLISLDPKLLDLTFDIIFSNHLFSLDLIAPRVLQSELCRNSLCSYLKRRLNEMSSDPTSTALVWNILSHYEILQLSLISDDSLAFDALSLCAHKDRKFFLHLMPLIAQHPQMISLLERVLTAQLMMISTQDQALMVANGIFEYQDELQLDDDSSLCLQAASVKMTILHTPEHKNPYSIFALHQALSLKKIIVLNKPLLLFDGKIWKFSSDFFKRNLVLSISLDEVLRVSGGRRFSSRDLQAIVEEIKRRFLALSEEDRERVIYQLHQAHETSLNELCNNLLSPYFLDLLNLPYRDENTLAKSYFCAIFSYLHSLSDDTSQDDFFSPRERAALVVSESIQNCSVGKEEGIVAFYNRLEPQFQYISSCQDDDLPIVAKVKTAALGHVQQKALDLLSSDSAMMKQMCGFHGDIPQLSHHCLYVKNRIARHLGISHDIRFDPNTELLSEVLLSRSTTQLLRIFYDYMSLQSLAQDFICYVQRLSEEEKSQFFNGINEMFTKDVSIESLWIIDDNTGGYLITEEAALRVLHAIGCMMIAKK